MQYSSLRILLSLSVPLLISAEGLGWWRRPRWTLAPAALFQQDMSSTIEVPSTSQGGAGQKSDGGAGVDLDGKTLYFGYGS